MDVNRSGYILRTLVLDISYRPLKFITLEKAFLLDYQRRCNTIQYFDPDFITFKTVTEEYLIPSVIQINTRREMYTQSTPSRIAIIHRDDFTCAYCGRYTPNPTIDHVIPKSKGGGWSWENLVTCCEECNQKKGDTYIEPKYVKPHRPDMFKVSYNRVKKTLHPIVKELVKMFS